MKLASPCLLLLALIVPCWGIRIPTTALPNGIVSDGYEGTVTASGGCAPYTWSLISGSLPAGLKMQTYTNTSVLVLYGTPTRAASYTFELAAKGCGGHSAKASYTVVVQSKAYHAVDLSWVPSTTKDVVGYNIYRGADARFWVQVNSSLDASTAYTDLTAANSTTYFYATTAVDVHGKESKKSNIVQVAIP